MCFSVLINRPERSLLGCLWSNCMFGLTVHIIINISGSLIVFEDYNIQYVFTSYNDNDNNNNTNNTNNNNNNNDDDDDDDNDDYDDGNNILPDYFL